MRRPNHYTSAPTIVQCTLVVTCNRVNTVALYRADMASASARSRPRSYPLKAFCAALTARSTSLTSLSGMVAQTLPVDGSKLSRRRSSAAWLNSPSMKFSTWMRPSVAITAASLFPSSSVQQVPVRHVRHVRPILTAAASGKLCPLAPRQVLRYCDHLPTLCLRQLTIFNYRTEQYGTGLKAVMPNGLEGNCGPRGK